jgi:hypothetical protein
MERGRRTRRALVAVAAAGAIVTLAVLAWLAGAGRWTDDRPIVEGVPSEARKAQLDQAEEASRANRDAARKELERLDSPR